MLHIFLRVEHHGRVGDQVEVELCYRELVREPKMDGMIIQMIVGSDPTHPKPSSANTAGMQSNATGANHRVMSISWCAV